MVEAARSWARAGARFLHVVDLDGARSGEPASLGHLERITRETGLPVQYGGGLRTLPAVREALRAGADRVVVGTAAFRDVDFLDGVAFSPDEVYLTLGEWEHQPGPGTDYTGQDGTGVILAFYPGDETAVCTKQMCAYRDASDRLDELGMPLLGISPQGVESHESFKTNHSLTMPLLADTDKTVAASYGTLGPIGFPRRSVFIIDAEGIIRYAHKAIAGLTYRPVSELITEIQKLR